MSQTDTVARDQPAQKRPGAAAPGEAAVRRANRTRLMRPILMVGGPLLLALGVLLFWLTGGQYVSSDDSYVNAAKVSLSTDVSGLVGKVYVRNNQHVEAGQKLFSLVPSSFDIAVESARAQLAQAVLDINAARRGYAEALAQIAVQRAKIAEDQTNLRRYAAVVGNGGVTRSTYDDARYALQADQAQLSQLEAAAGLQLAKLSGNANIPVTQTPEYQSALATLNNALREQRNSVVTPPSRAMSPRSTSCSPACSSRPAPPPSGWSPTAMSGSPPSRKRTTSPGSAPASRSRSVSTPIRARPGTAWCRA